MLRLHNSNLRHKSMITLIKETAMKIIGIRPSENDPSLTVLEFDNGTKDTFLPWFIDAKKPRLGSFYVKDSEGFIQIVDAI